MAEGRVAVDAQEAALDVDRGAGAAEGVDAAEGEEARAGLGEREARAAVRDDPVDGVGRVGGEDLVRRRGGGAGREQERRAVGHSGDLRGERDVRAGDRHAHREHGSAARGQCDGTSVVGRGSRGDGRGRGAGEGERGGVEGDVLRQGDGSVTEGQVVAVDGEALLPDHRVGAGERDRRTGDVADRDAGTELKETRTEGVRRTEVEGTGGEVESARTGAGARERQRTIAGLGDRGIEGHATREGQRGAVGARAVDRPSLDAGGGDRSRDGDRAGVGLDFDAVVRATGVDRKRAAGTGGDREGRDARRGRGEDEAVDGQGRVDRGGDGRTDRIGSAEDQRVGGRRDDGGRSQAREVLGPGRDVVPGSAGDAVEVTVDDRADVQHERGAGGGRGVELVVQAGRGAAEDPVREVQAAGGGQERVGARGDAAEAVQVEGDGAAEGRTRAEDDGVVGTRGADIEAERGTAAEAEDRRTKGDRRTVEEVQRRAVGDIEGGDAADGEAGAEGALRDGGDAAVEVDGTGDGRLTETGLGQVGRGRGADDAGEVHGGEAVRDVERGAVRADRDVLRSGDGDRDGEGARARVGERAAVDDDGAGAEVGALGEGDRARVDAELAREGVGPGERDEARGGLHRVDRAAEDGGDGTRAEIEVGGGSEDTGGTGEGTADQRHAGYGVIEGRDVEGTAVDREGGQVGKGVVRTERERARVHGRGAAEAVGAGQREHAGPILGKGGRGAGDGTGDGDVARAAEGQGVGAGDQGGGARERQRAGVGLDKGGSRERHRTREGVGAAEIAERAGAAEARAAEADGLGRHGDAALEFKGGSIGDGRVADDRTEGVGVADAEDACVDGDGSVEGVRAREEQRAEAVLGDGGRGAGEGARDDEVTRAVEGDGVGAGREGRGVAEDERTRVGLDERGSAQRDRAGEGVDTAEIAERAGGADARAGDGEGFVADGDAAAEFEGRAIGDGSTSGRVTERGRVTDGEQAGSDRRGARVGTGAGEEDRTRTDDIDGARARDGVGGGIGAGAVEDEGAVVDDRARTEGARGRTRADLERAGGDGELAREAVVAFEDERARGGLGEDAAAVDLGDVLKRAGLEEHVVDRAGERADRVAVQIEGGVVELEGRGDRAEAVADALRDLVAHVDRAARDVQGRDGGAVAVRRAAEGDRTVDGDAAS